VLGSTAVNVGIGTNAPASKLHIVSNNTGSPVRIQNQSNSNHSGIHFYSNSGTLMGQVGFANPGSGLLANTMYIGSIAGSPTVITTGDVERVRVDATGNVGIGTNAPTADLEINGFTKLGSTAPAIKTKKLAGTTAALQASQTIITHGIVTHTKILAVDLYIDNISGLSIPPDLTAISNNQYNYFISTSSIIINFINGNAAQIVNRPFRILITYEE
jgi:hypothetical protein